MNMISKDYLKTTRLSQSLLRRTPFIYQSARSFYKNMQHGGLAQRRDMTYERLQVMLKAASKMAFYQNRECPQNFDDWPMLEKEDVRDNADGMMNSMLLPSANAMTSGTTGLPLHLKRSWKSVVYEQAAIDFFVSKAGVNFREARVALIRADSIKDPADLTPPFWEIRSGGRHLVYSANHLCARTIDDYLDMMKSFKPDILWVFPTTLESLYGFADSDHIDIPGLKLVLATSETLQTESRKKASAIFNVPVYDYYGQAERVALSYSLQAKEHFFYPGYGRVELLHSHEDDEHAYYEIVGTSLWNEAQPLIRYRTGDFAMLDKAVSDEDLENICYGLKPFKGVSGRTSDYILSPDGVHLMAIDHIPRGIDQLVQMQIVQTSPDKVDINIVVRKSYTEETRAHVMRNARAKLPDTMTININVVEQLQRTKRGKAPLIIRNLAQDYT